MKPKNRVPAPSMQITWYGLACFKIQTDATTLITDPEFSGSGLRGPRLQANVVTFSTGRDWRKLEGGTTPTPRIIHGPGEYEIGGILIEGTAVLPGGAHTCYRVIADGINILALGPLATLPDNGQLATLGGCDVLLVPVGGGPVLPAAAASRLVGLLEPRIVIPCSYRLPGLTVKLDPLDKFCQEIGVCPTEELPKLKLQRKDLPAGELKVIVLAKV